jgi:hypothetical protein
MSTSGSRAPVGCCIAVERPSLLERTEAKGAGQELIGAVVSLFKQRDGVKAADGMLRRDRPICPVGAIFGSRMRDQFQLEAVRVAE